MKEVVLGLAVSHQYQDFVVIRLLGGRGGFGQRQIECIGHRQRWLIRDGRRIVRVIVNPASTDVLLFVRIESGEDGIGVFFEVPIALVAAEFGIDGDAALSSSDSTREREEAVSCIGETANHRR